MTQKFCVTALGDWLQACREADVPYVRADRIVEFQVEDLMNWDVEGPHGDRLAKGWRTAQAAEQQNCMFRWDFCASSDLKYAMAKPLFGGRFHNSFGKVPTIDDPRVIDIMLEHPRQTVALWRRPWVQARVIDEYPHGGRYSLTGDFHGVWHTEPFETIEIAMRAADIAEKSLRRNGPPA